MTLLQDHLDQVMAWSLKHGSHAENADGNLCVMEAVAYVFGRPWSDSPPCVSPAIGSFMRSWNDALPTDADRDRLLKPLIPTLLDTATTADDEQRRAFMAMDWLVRVWTPKWLELVPSLKPHAVSLRECEEICDVAGLVAATAKLGMAQKASSAARAAAWDAAWDAGWDAASSAARAAARAAAWAAAWAAARDAARAAAWAAARDAARAAAWDAAWAAAWAAAWDAAWDAAWAAAWAAAGDAVRLTVEWCQQSAVDLVQRMCEVGRVKPFFARPSR